MTRRRAQLRRLAIVRAAVAVALGCLVVLVPARAYAGFLDGTAVGHSLLSATLAEPTATATAHGACSTLTGPKLVVSWTATASTWASGYEVGLATAVNGPYSVYSVSGQATTSFTTPALSFSTTYYVIVRSMKGSWRSAWTSPVSRTTKNLLCL